MRRKLDAYYTPSHAVHTLKEYWHGWQECDHLIEPCVGDGAIVREFPEKPWITNDIDPNVKADFHGDARESIECYFKEMYGKKAIITNPPFKDAFEIYIRWVRLCAFHGQSNLKLAMLLRLSFLEPTKKRAPVLSTLPPRMVIVLPRISFTGDGKTDSVTCAWMIWDNNLRQSLHIAPKPMTDG
jgi:hypothetical protein